MLTLNVQTSRLEPTHFRCQSRSSISDLFTFPQEIINSWLGWISDSYRGWWKIQKLPNFYSPHRCGSIAGRLAVIVFEHSCLWGESKKSGIRLTRCLLNKAALKAQATMCPLKHEWHAREGCFSFFFFWVKTLHRMTAERTASFQYFPREENTKSTWAEERRGEEGNILFLSRCFLS